MELKTCETCKFANWKRTSNGRLHPDKTGRCTFKWEPPPIPKAFYFHFKPSPSGGFIERGKHANNDCPCHEEKQT